MGLVRPAQRSLGGTAQVLLGTPPHSGRNRGVPSESMDQVQAMDKVMRRLGCTTHI